MHACLVHACMHACAHECTRTYACHASGVRPLITQVEVPAQPGYTQQNIVKRFFIDAPAYLMAALRPAMFVVQLHARPCGCRA